MLQNFPHFFEPDYYLPAKFDETYLTLMIRDPKNIFAYWEVSNGKVQEFKECYGPALWEASKLAIRLHWENYHQVVQVNEDSSSWYIYLGEGGLPVNGELGRLLPDNTFIVLTNSNYLARWSFNYNLDFSNDSVLSRSSINWQPGISS